MKVTTSWINEYLGRTILSDQIICEAFEQAGLEIEQIISSTKIDEKVVVALVKKVIQHPSADRLHLVDVTTGEQDYRVVCGAPNVRVGLKVALAQIGAVLPNGERIQKAKLRGETSEGMLCSERELGLGNDHEGIMELSSDVAIGTSLCDLWPSDCLIDMKTPANRFDVQSVMGLAREVAAIANVSMTPPSPAMLRSTDDGPEVQGGISAVRYMLARVRVEVAPPSLDKMVARLTSVGVRSLGALVDVTNYVMLETGQPLHAFDAAKVKLPIEVRFAHSGERLTTLDGVARTLSDQDLIIADQAGPIGLAGLMGGAATEIGPETTEILLEAGTFDGATVRKMAKRHGLRTEASARFERGLPIHLPPLALSRAVELLSEMTGGTVLGVTDVMNTQVEPRSITLPFGKLLGVLGFVISHKEALDVLDRLQITASYVGNLHRDDDEGKGSIVVSEVPWWRPDLKLAEDLIEEIVRVIGYDKVPSTLPRWQPKNVEFDKVRNRRRLVRDLMYGVGLFEVMTYSFVSSDQLIRLGYRPEDHLKLKNPLSSEQAYLRSNMMASHLEVLSRNRNYAKELGFYELSHVFIKRDGSEQPDEPFRLAVTVARPERAFAFIKGILDALAEALNVDLRVEPGEGAGYAPGRAGVIRVGNEDFGRIGQFHPEVLRNLKIEVEAAYLELDLAPLLTMSATRTFTGVSRYPSIMRDVAVLGPRDVTWQMIVDALAPQMVEFVDEYDGVGVPEGYRSITLRINLTHPERTPTEAEASELERKVVTRLERKLGLKRR